jgi:hypothetical protein
MSANGSLSATAWPQCLQNKGGQAAHGTQGRPFWFFQQPVRSRRDVALLRSPESRHQVSFGAT